MQCVRFTTMCCRVLRSAYVSPQCAVGSYAVRTFHHNAVPFGGCAVGSYAVRTFHHNAVPFGGCAVGSTQCVRFTTMLSLVPSAAGHGQRHPPEPAAGQGRDQRRATLLPQLPGAAGVQHVHVAHAAPGHGLRPRSPAQAGPHSPVWRLLPQVGLVASHLGLLADLSFSSFR